MDDSGETGLDEDDVSGMGSGVGGTFDCDTDIGTGKGGGVVGTVASHGEETSKALETKLQVSGVVVAVVKFDGLASHALGAAPERTR